MSVTIHPSTTSCGSDPEKLRERLDEIQLCETFNADFSPASKARDARGFWKDCAPRFPRCGIACSI